MDNLNWSGRAYVRALNETAIILDVVADRYFRAPLAPLPAHGVLWDDGGRPLAFDESTQQRLLEARLLRRAAPGAVAPMRDGAEVMAACVWADWSLRAKRLHYALARLAYLKRLGRDDGGRRSLERFERWRPLYPRDYVCLIDSLALARYLLLGGTRLALVIGVRDGPFSAHAWVAVDGEAINDRLGQWRSYLPILEI
ncbi:MAG: lasso peptide biosynthesis B2 protein [Hyphomonadaceae bacterium]|nr:lasso peptide biosynthesis B2 protein [Hyphomonadaceae bacterium]